MPNFMKNCRVGAELLKRAGGRKEKLDEADGRFPQFAGAPDKTIY